MRFKCKRCPVVFVGAGAIHRWSAHTWTHPEDVPRALGGLRDDT